MRTRRTSCPWWRGSFWDRAAGDSTEDGEMSGSVAASPSFPLWSACKLRVRSGLVPAFGLGAYGRQYAGDVFDQGHVGENFARAAAGAQNVLDQIADQNLPQRASAAPALFIILYAWTAFACSVLKRSSLVSERALQGFRVNFYDAIVSSAKNAELLSAKDPADIRIEECEGNWWSQNSVMRVCRLAQRGQGCQRERRVRKPSPRTGPCVCPLPVVCQAPLKADRGCGWVGAGSLAPVQVRALRRGQSHRLCGGARARIRHERQARCGRRRLGRALPNRVRAAHPPRQPATPVAPRLCKDRRAAGHGRLELPENGVRGHGSARPVGRDGVLFRSRVRPRANRGTTWAQRSC